MTDENLSSDDLARNLLSAFGGDAATSDVKKELAKTSEQVFGKRLNSDDKIDAMNDAITGFAIAAGTSPLATENIANGMLVGLKSMKQTEQRRVDTRDALAIAGARAAAKGATGDGTYNKLYQKAMEKIMTRPEEFGIDAYDKKDENGDPILGSGIDAASEQITTLADRIARAQAGGGPTPTTTQPMTQMVAKDAAGNEFYSTDGVNFVDKEGNPYVPPQSTGQ